MSDGAKVSVRLYGRFRVLDADGTSRTPKSAKAQGLLALLLTNSDDYERGRLWLQDKLWSDRPQKQGSDSLRQAMRDIRVSLGDLADILLSNRTMVRLDPSRVDLEKPEPGAQLEFLEGIDIRDPEFNIWLAEQRAATARRVPILPAPAINRQLSGTLSILFHAASGMTELNRLTEEKFISRVTRSLRDELNVDVLRGLPAQAPPGVLLGSVQAFTAPDGRLAVRASVEDIDANRVLWSDIAAAQPGVVDCDDDTNIMALVNKMFACFKLSARRDRPDRIWDTDANLLALMAVQNIFTLKSENLVEAETMLYRAFEIEQRGVYQSWLAQLYTIQLVERFKSFDDIADKSDSACARALELEPDNSNVLASVADASLAVRRNFARSAQLAQMSVDANPSNPLAWWSMAAGHLYLNEKPQAHRAASVAQKLAQGSRLRFWADVQRGLTALVNGKTVEGLRNLESCNALTPNFRAPLRYRAAIYASAGMVKSAIECADTLKTYEPDFSFDRLSNDPDYPVSLMRKHGMLDTIRLD